MLPRVQVLLAVFALLLQATLAANVTYNWNVTWTTGSPDGYERRVIGINGSWPLPAIEVNKGDRLIINLFNGLGDQGTSLHFHGLFQNGTTYMDGPVGVTQCTVPPGRSIIYDFVVDQPGTYWYHSHQKGQYPDGIRGAFIVHDTDDPHKDLYDEEVFFTLSDWYHKEMKVLRPQFISVANPTGAEPVPDAALFNDTQNLDIAVTAGKTYQIRIMSVSAFAPQYVWFEGHTMRVVEVDGVYTDPYETDMIYVMPAQRISVLITMKNETGTNYPFMGSMDTDLFDTVPSSLNPNVTGWLVYDSKATKPAAQFVDAFDPLDDINLVPTDKMPLLPEPDYSFNLDVNMNNLGDGANYAFFNNITYVSPKVPTLYTALSAGMLATNTEIYGEYTHSFVLNHMDVIEIVLNNQDTGKHPFHLHGHNFQVVHRSDDDAGDWNSSSASETTYPAIPMRRDTVLARPSSNVLLRFRADNPGIWFFHCHIEWHLDSGLVATMVEAPLILQSNTTIPADHLANCRAAGVPTAGNAAGNTMDLLDLSGQNKPPNPLPAGFTAKGYVALVFSCVAGFVGMGFIAWYGIAEIPGGGIQHAGNGVIEVASGTGS